MRELARLLYLIVIILPLTVLLLGPLLTLAAIRGVQRMGPIFFNPGRRGTAGRLGALLLGLLVWLAVWGSLAAVLGRAGLPALSRAALPGSQAYLSLTPAPASAQPPTPAGEPFPSSPRDYASPRDDAATPPTLASVGGVERPGQVGTPTLAPTLTPQPTATPAPSSTPGLEAPTLFPSPISTPISPSPTSPRPAATFTPTPSPSPPAPSPQPSTATPSPTLAATLSPTQREEAISAVETANELLRAAVVEASSENLAALEGRWQGRALTKAQAFAQDLYERYSHPLQVTFEYLRPHSMQQGASTAMAVVTSLEVWTYAGRSSSHTESFEFIYTLSRQGADWVITDYTYRNAPTLQPSATPAITSPITATTTLTATTAITPAAP